MKKPLLTLLIGIVTSGSTALAQYIPYVTSANAGNYQQNMYNQVGAPINGAYPGVQYPPGGQYMLNQCAYPQQIVEDPTDKDKLVIAAKADLRKAVDEYKKSIKDYAKAESEFEKKKAPLDKALKGSGLDSSKFLDAAVNCEDVYGSYDASTSSTTATNNIGDAVVQSKGLRGNDLKLACYEAVTPKTQSTSANFEAGNMCTTQGQHILTNIKKDFDGKGLVHDRAACASAADDAYQAYKDQKAAKDAMDAAEKAVEDAKDAIADRRDKAKEIQELLDEADALDGANAKNVGDRCEGCNTAELAKKAGPSKLAILGGIGATLFATGLSMHNQDSQCNRFAQGGYYQLPATCGQGTVLTNAVSAGLPAGNGFFQMANQGSGYGYPMTANGLYGQVPQGYGRGGIGCAPTMYQSQMGWPQGPFVNPANSNFYPGGAYMPMMGPWGVNGFPGGFPGSGFPGFPGMPGGFPGGGFNNGGYNPYAQQMAYLSNQYQDSLRAQQVAMYSMGYGMNNMMTQYQFAQSMLGGGGGQFGGGQFGGGQFGGGQFGQFGGSQFGQFGGSQFGALSPGGFGGGSCGNMFSTFSLCAAIPTGNQGPPGYFNGGAPFGQTPFLAPPYGGSQYSPYGGTPGFSGGIYNLR